MIPNLEEKTRRIEEILNRHPEIAVRIFALSSGVDPFQLEIQRLVEGAGMVCPTDQEDSEKT